jgi:hypothetical protein
MTIQVEAVSKGYWTNKSGASKIMNPGEKFTIDSIEQFSRGIMGRRSNRRSEGQVRFGWMKLVGISKDHKEPTKELQEQLKQVIAATKSMEPEQETFEEPEKFQSINDVSDEAAPEEVSFVDEGEDFEEVVQGSDFEGEEENVEI